MQNIACIACIYMVSPQYESWHVGQELSYVGSLAHIDYTHMCSPLYESLYADKDDSSVQKAFSH